MAEKKVKVVGFSKIIYHINDSAPILAITIALTIFEHTTFEPQSIELDNGCIIPWNKQKAILFLKGSINMNDLMAG